VEELQAIAPGEEDIDWQIDAQQLRNFAKAGANPLDTGGQGFMRTGLHETLRVYANQGGARGGHAFAENGVKLTGR
jgi:hypothetical protein